jgi:hypothetical protein
MNTQEPTPNAAGGASALTAVFGGLTFERGTSVIDFKTIKVGDKVKVVGAGAPGFAKLGDELEITKVGEMRVDAKRSDGEEAFFALTCGAARLELVTPNA